MQESKTTKPLWGGFINGKLDDNDCLLESCQRVRAPALFLRKTDAKLIYEDVRKIKIVEVK